MPFLDQEALSQFPKVRQLSSNFNSENWKTIAQTLFQINVMIGSRETITPAEMVKLCEFLVKHYKDFNAKEIEHAFELFATRELPEIDYSKDRIYNKLSIVVLGFVLSPYRTYRREKISSEKAKVPRIEQDPNHDKLMFYSEQIFIPYGKMLRGEGDHFLGWALRRMYKEMNPKGLFSQYVKDGTYKDFLAQAEIETIRKVENFRLEKEEQWRDRIRDKARELLVKDWLIMQCFEEAAIEETLKNYIIEK